MNAPATALDIQIPSPPALLLDLERLMDEPRVNLQAIAERIAQDAGVTAQIFRLLASPAYGLRRPPDSLGKAVSILGINSLHNLVKSICLHQTLSGDSPFFEAFWERSAEIARLAATIAWSQRSVCNVLPEHAHLVGLFHDCGIPVLAMRYPDYSASFLQGSHFHWPDVHEEDARYQTDHSVVGFLVARHWNLPDYVCQAVRYHHEIVNTEHKAASLVAILQMALHIHNVNHHLDDADWAREQARVVDELGLDGTNLSEYVEDIYERTHAA
ncbi:MAG: HDOD domain-containing protein [Thiobacillaceae bacterium]|jgi:HD-like signal output (HDOD) protein|nr:HDOD domain-containing protein [Thiobacillaceae bacterium]